MAKVNFNVIIMLLVFCCCQQQQKNTPNKIVKKLDPEINLLPEIFKLGLDSCFLELSKQPVFALNKINIIQTLKSSHLNKPILYADTITSNNLLSDKNFKKNYQLLIYNQYSKADTLIGLVTDRNTSTTYIFNFLLKDKKLKFIDFHDIQPKFSYPQPFNNKSVQELFYNK